MWRYRSPNYWAYNTGGTVSTSATLLADVTQIAFVQTVSSAANLVILKWKPANGTIGSPATPTSESTSNYRSCAAPCMTTITFYGGLNPASNDTNSAPFYDYANGVIYVGDNAGLLHKFTGVFNGIPAEVTASPWPVTVMYHSTTCRAGANGCLTLSSPIYDSLGKIFVGNGVTDNTFFFTGGQLSAVTALSGAVAATSQLGHGAGVADAPLVDSAAGRVYAFVGNDGSSNCGSLACSAVFQFHTDLSSPTETTVGTGHATSGAITLYSGTFDNRTTSAASRVPAGISMSVETPREQRCCFRIPITNNAMSGASIPMNTALSTANTTCSPVTEIFNFPNDWIFLSVQADGNTNSNVGCPASGCVMSFDVSSGTTPSSTAARAAAAGGTSGIIVDNAVGSGTLKVLRKYTSLA